MKQIRVGVCTIRNEGGKDGGIIGWARMLYHFCKEVYALVDPATTDDTVELLKQFCPYVKVQYQDRNLGDSDEDTIGPTGTLIMHKNKTKWINENIEDGEWFIEMAADERFNPIEFKVLEEEIKYAQESGCDSLVHQVMYEPLPLYESQLLFREGCFWFDSKAIPEPNSPLFKIQFSINWQMFSPLAHARFQVKNEGWKQCDQSHHGFEFQSMNPMWSMVPIYHFHRMKDRKPSWRDARGSITKVIKKYNGLIPLIPFRSPIRDWKDMDNYKVDLDNPAFRDFMHKKTKRIIAGNRKYVKECKERHQEYLKDKAVGVYDYREE